MKWKPKKGKPGDGRKKEKKKLEESRDKNQPKTALIKYPNSVQSTLGLSHFI